MTAYKNQNRFLQFELWKDCHIGCKFCVNKGQPDLNKIQSLKFTMRRIKQEIKDYNEIGFIGGEFFNGELSNPEVKDLFYELFKQVADLVHSGQINKVYITTSLIFDMDLYLIPFLEYIEKLGILDKLLICTSYDVAYRFYTQEREQLWKDNMLRLRLGWSTRGLPNIHTETIITQPFIDAVLSGKFNITVFCKIYGTRIDYIEPASGLYYKNKKECNKDIPGFFPTKNSFIKFLRYVADRGEIDLSTFLSMELRSSKLYYIDGGKRLVQEDRRAGEGKAKPCDCTKLYEIGLIDSDEKMVDIARTIGEEYEDE